MLSIWVPNVKLEYVVIICLTSMAHLATEDKRQSIVHVVGICKCEHIMTLRMASRGRK